MPQKFPVDPECYSTPQADLGGSPDEMAAGLATQFGDRIRLFATRRLASVNAAEDVVQETLRRVLEALRNDRVRDLAALPGFVFETARHVCLHRLRSIQREGQAFGRLAATTPPAQPDALAKLISEERREAVRRALATLSEMDRALLIRTYVDDADDEDIAVELGISSGTLRVRRHRALKRLGERLGGVTDPRKRELKSHGDEGV
jgi:RNA polymerase sigma-70 factor (ECF subfamily)